MILFFQPIPRPAIWGKTAVKDYFGYDDFPTGIGQAWAFSAQKENSTICLSEPYQGKTLGELWENHQELFGHPGEDFPVIISLVGPEADLSIQVHPDANYAQAHGLKSGKNEAWYFIEADPQASIVYGHNARDESDLYRYIRKEQWDKLIRKRAVHPGDFVYLPAGLLHALGKGCLVYEIQQATDITYRFYDYHRKDAKGKERQLHLTQAVACLSYDEKQMENRVVPRLIKYPKGKQTIYIAGDSFTVVKLEIKGELVYQTDNYQLATVIKGSGSADSIRIKTGDSFLIPQKSKVIFDGNITIMMTTK